MTCSFRWLEHLNVSMKMIFRWNITLLCTQSERDTKKYYISLAKNDSKLMKKCSTEILIPT